MRLRLLSALLLAFGAISPASFAQVGAEAPVEIEAAAPVRTQFDAAAVEAWAESFFAPLIEDKRLTGASFGLVQDGEVVFLRGWGHEDLGRGVELDPLRTLFRMCSTSKTFTATSLMQLVERGAIASLDDPVNRYAKRFQLPPPYGDQVTLRQLMTHSSGMAGHFTPQGTQIDHPVPVSEAEVAKMFRENIERPPGTIGQYANLGVALESVVIEDLSGKTFADYITEEIYLPLGMADALVHHETAVPDRLAQPYGIFADGSLQAVPFYPKHPLTAASGGVVATPRDMLRYAAFHADEEALSHPELLSAEGRQELHRRHFGHHPGDPGIGLHFYPSVWGGERFASHGCGLPGTTSLLGVLPESRAGIVYSLLAAGPSPSAGDVVGRLFGRGRLVGDQGPGSGGFSNPGDAFLEKFVGPEELPEAGSEAVSSVETDLEALPGTYWTERRTLTGVATLFASGSVVEVSRGEGDSVLVRNELHRQVAPGVFDAEDGGRVIFRRPDPEGPVYLHRGVSSSYRRVSGLGDPTVVTRLMNYGLLLSLTALLAFFWPRPDDTSRWLRRIALAFAVSLLVIPVSLFAGYETLSAIFAEDAFNGATGRFAFSLVLVNLAGLLGLAVIAGAVVAWRRQVWEDGKGALLCRLHLTALAVGVVLTWPAFRLFHLVGLQF